MNGQYTVARACVCVCGGGGGGMKAVQHQNRNLLELLIVGFQCFDQTN